MIHKAFPQDSEKVIDLKNKISKLLDIDNENINVYFGYEHNPNFLHIKLQEKKLKINHLGNAVKEIFNFQKLINLQNELGIKINLFRIYDEKVILFWCEFSNQLNLL